jgi:hypothetical protein
VRGAVLSIPMAGSRSSRAMRSAVYCGPAMTGDGRAAGAEERAPRPEIEIFNRQHCDRLRSYFVRPLV